MLLYSSLPISSEKPSEKKKKDNLLIFLKLHMKTRFFHKCKYCDKINYLRTTRNVFTHFMNFQIGYYRT